MEPKNKKQKKQELNEALHKPYVDNSGRKQSTLERYKEKDEEALPDTEPTSPEEPRLPGTLDQSTQALPVGEKLDIINDTVVEINNVSYFNLNTCITIYFQNHPWFYKLHKQLNL